MSLADRVVLVTGATGGLGRLAVARFLAEGATVAVAGTDQSRLDELAESLAGPDDRLVPVVGDLRDGAAAHALVDTVVERAGRVDILLHLVGGYAGGSPLVETPADDLRTMLDQHVWTAFHLCQAVVPGMVERGWGRLISISAPVATTPTAKNAAYAAGKAGQEALFRSLARDVGSTGVTANLLVVRKIDVDHAREREPKPANASWTTPEELVAAMVYLCSDDAAAITGARIPMHERG